MLDYKTCTELKEAGFPQELRKGDWYYFIGRKGIWLVDSDRRAQTMTDDQYIKCPTVEQLILNADFNLKRIEKDLVDIYIADLPDEPPTPERQKPFAYVWHKEFSAYVPVLEIDVINGSVTWDDNQWDRCIPPNPCYEIDDTDKFDLDKNKTPDDYNKSLDD